MADIRIKDTDTKAAFASDDEVIMDSPTGTGTMLRDNFISAVAAIIKAAPETYGLATLDGSNKLTSSQDPSQSVSYLGGHDVVANSPALADGSGTAGDTYYVTNPGTRDYGSGNITAAEGDALVYSGSVWQLVEGIANILDGISTASTARTTLEVNSVDEDAEATGTKLVGPALYFRGAGPNDYVEVADNAKLSFTDGTDDLPFSVSVWVKASDWSSTGLVTKRNAAREWTLATTGSDKLEFAISDTTNTPYVSVDTALTGYEDEWIHICLTYGGAGPNSDSAFTAAADEMTAYINGSAVASTATNNASYTGMADGSDAVWIGRNTSNYLKGHISNVQIFNRELSAAEVATLARSGQLGFADEWGGATATSGTLTVGKRYRLRDWITGDDFTNVGASSNADGVEFIATGTTPTTWTNSSVVENIGTLADFRAEDFNESAGKLLDRSSNNFVGTNNGATLVGSRRHISADTIDLKNLPTSSAGLSAGEVWSNSGVLTIVT